MKEQTGSVKNTILSGNKDHYFKTAATVSTILVSAAACLLFISNRAIPFMMDDEWYATNLRDGGTLKGLSDIIVSQVWHWHNWGGRVVTHGFLQLSLMSGEFAADIINTLMTLLLVFEMYYLSRLSGDAEAVSGKKDLFTLGISIFALEFGLLIACCPNFKMSMLWQAGCANYVYSSVWILLFYLIYIRALDTDKKDIPFSVIFMIPLGLITGWSTENMGPAAFVTASVITYVSMRSGKAAGVRRIWMIEGVVASFLGSVMCIIAPGNFIRKDDSAELALSVSDRLIQMLKGIGEYMFPALLVLSVGYMLLRAADKKITSKEITLLAGALLSYGAMILSPHYPDRAAFGTCVLLEICAGSFFHRSLGEKNREALPTVAMLCVVAAMVIMGTVNAI